MSKTFNPRNFWIHQLVLITFLTSSIIPIPGQSGWAALPSQPPALSSAPVPTVTAPAPQPKPTTTTSASTPTTSTAPTTPTTSSSTGFLAASGTQLTTPETTAVSPTPSTDTTVAATDPAPTASTAAPAQPNAQIEELIASVEAWGAQLSPERRDEYNFLLGVVDLTLTLGIIDPATAVRALTDLRERAMQEINQSELPPARRPSIFEIPISAYEVSPRPRRLGPSLEEFIEHIRSHFQPRLGPMFLPGMIVFKGRRLTDAELFLVGIMAKWAYANDQFHRGLLTREEFINQVIAANNELAEWLRTNRGILNRLGRLRDMLTELISRPNLSPDIRRRIQTTIRELESRPFFVDSLIWGELRDISEEIEGEINPPSTDPSDPRPVPVIV